MSVAVFVDVENIRYSVINTYSEPEPYWAGMVQQCKDYGKISSFQAFDDWSKLPSQAVHEVQKCGIQPVFVPLSEWNKSSLDCYLIVAAMKVLFQNETIDTLILGSGDRDYIPLTIEARAMGKHVVLMAVEDTLSQDLRGNVDDVFFYQPLKKQVVGADEIESGQRFVVEVLEDLEASSRHEDFGGTPGWVNLATLGFRLKRVRSEFSHKNYGYLKLIDMLKEIPRIELKYDDHEKLVAMARTVQQDRVQQPGTSKTLSGSIQSIKANGYGFIKPDIGVENIFFHSNKCLTDISSLRDGDRVTYELFNTMRGPNAENVLKVGDTPEPRRDTRAEFRGEQHPEKRPERRYDFSNSLSDKLRAAISANAEED